MVKPLLTIALLVTLFAARLPAADDQIISCSNAALNVSFDMQQRTFTVVNRAAHRRWEQPPKSISLEPFSAKRRSNGFDIYFRHRPGNSVVQMHLTLTGNEPEFQIILDGDGPMERQLMFPAPFLNADDNYLILPINAGLSLGVEDPRSIKGQIPFQTGHGLNMPFFGATDGRDGCMAIVESPDDAKVLIGETDGRTWIAPIWQPQLGRWGPPRKIRYVFPPSGGYVAMAKRYRRHAATNLYKLDQKRLDRPSIDRLVGAANVWYWKPNGLDVLREMQAMGISRILWSRAENEQTVREMNSMGVLTGRYEIYRAVMDPALIPQAVYPKPDWPQGAWPNGLQMDEQKMHLPGWSVRLKDGSTVQTLHTCDRVVVALAQAKMADELSRIPFTARFIDTTAALSLDECYDPRHLMTRSVSRTSREQLFSLISNRFRIIAGSEDGADCYVPYCDYFEGMMSIVRYRSVIPVETLGDEVDPPPPNIVDLQLNETIRIPLWELVYHDCCVSYWHWDDTNNKYPAAWRRRDLFNALYGTPPMYGITRDIWDKRKEQFAASFREAATTARETGYSEMIDHRYLTRDRHVQQTRFANGIVVTVNFGRRTYEMDDGQKLGSESWRLERSSP